MSDLISRNKAISVLEQLNEHSLNGKMDILNAIYLLENQPTAYDIDKVVDEFEKNIRNKAIDDFVKEICKMFVKSEKNGNYRFYAVEIKQTIADLAEQLKAGEKDA